jgi:glucose/arabinose dehydrogenase
MPRVLRRLVLAVLGIGGGLVLGLGVLWWQAPRMDRVSEAPPASVAGPDGIRWEVRTLATGLDAPWALALLPGGEALVTERGGRLWRRVADGTLRPVSGVPEPVVGGQGGLFDVLVRVRADAIEVALSLAARRNDGTVATAVVAGRLDGTVLRDVRMLVHAFPGAEEGGVHFGGRLASDGADGIFVTLGDRGTRDWAQTPGMTAGRILRVDWNGRPLGAGLPGWEPTVWSMGHRNPQGLVYDAPTGTLWSTEHGPSGGDELNRIVAGANYGWPLVSLGREYGTGRPVGTRGPLPGMTDPVFSWGEERFAPSGLAILRGPGARTWNGHLLAGGLAGRAVAVLDPASGREVARLLPGWARIRDVRTDAVGCVYLLTDAADARLVRLAPAGAACALAGAGRAPGR